tara:strand:- start:638 stop:943 length:306 start_codon:yes stop_codon:yes gene_type:complete
MHNVEIVNLPQTWKLVMHKYGISARSVASSAKVNLPHLYNVLNGKSSPTLDYVAKIDRVIAEMVKAKEDIDVCTRTNFVANEDSNETSRDTQQRVNSGLSA